MNLYSSPWNLISEFNVERIDEIARKILEKIGLRVPWEDLRNQLSSTGKVKTEGERVLIPEETAFEFWPQKEKKEMKNERKDTLFIYASEWPMFFVEPETLKILPFDREHLIANTKLLDSFYGSDLGGTVPGRLQDVSPQLREIETYYILCRYSRSARFPLVGDEWSFEWARKMAEVVGHDLSASIFVFSPLTFLGFNNVVFDISIYPGSMASGTVAFGSPEHFICVLTRAKIREYYRIVSDSVETLLTTAILPGPQANAEKLALTALSALAGFRVIEGAGTLGIDEIFSPQQLMIDVEIKEYIEAILKGMHWDEEKDPIELLWEGLEESHFLSVDWTVNNWRRFYWRPELFHQLNVPQRLQKKKNILVEAWEKARKRIEEHDYELDLARIKELEKILAKAMVELRG